MNKALDTADEKQVELIRFSGDEDHYLERAETRIRMLREIEKFLAAHIGN